MTDTMTAAEYRDLVAEDRRARGLCPRHPQVRVTSHDGMYDAPCDLCEQEMYEEAMMLDEQEHIDTHGTYSFPIGPTPSFTSHDYTGGRHVFIDYDDDLPF